VYGASSPLVDRGKVYVASGDEMTALNASNGTQAWQDDFEGDQFPPTFSQPAIDHGSIIAGWYYYSVGGVAGFDPDTGASNLNGGGGPGSFIAYGAPAVADAATVYDMGAVTSGGSISALHLGNMTGFIAYSPQPGGIPSSSDPMVSGERAFVSSGSTLLSFALDSCPPPPVPLGSYCGWVWSTPLAANGGMPVAISSTQVAVPLANGSVAVLDQATGALQWTAVTGSTAAQSPVSDGTNLYVGTADGKMRAFPAAGCGNATCAPLWTSSQSAGGAITSQPVYAAGVIYAGGKNGSLVAYDASNGTRLTLLLVDSGANRVNVIEDGGTVYVSTNGGNVAAYRP
jgi:outer membrane protein assembly factor BamB